MTYLLDTPLLVGYVRKAPWAEYAEKKFGLSTPPNITLMSVVSRGEILSLANQFGWGAQKREALTTELNKISFTDISHDSIVEAYAEIDAVSKRRFPGHKLPDHGLSKKMGKNDLWVAATAHVLGAHLLTTDRDFDHLADHFFELTVIDQKLTPIDAP